MRKTGVATEGVREIFPERVDPFAGVQSPQRVGSALRDKAAIGPSHFGPEERVIDPSLRRVDVEIARHEVIVAGEHGRFAGREQAPGMFRQPVEPAMRPRRSPPSNATRCRSYEGCSSGAGLESCGCDTDQLQPGRSPDEHP